MKTGDQTYSTAIESASNYTNWVLQPFRPYFGSSLLEVGLGHGGYREFLSGVPDYVGVDIDPKSIESAKMRHPSERFLCVDITAKNFREVTGSQSFTSVLCVNVLEHIEEDQAAVDSLFSSLAVGGHLLLFVPAFQFLYSPMDKMAGHHRRYNKDSLSELLDGRERSIIDIRYFNSIGGIGWWVNKFLPHSNLNSDAINNQIRIFDKFIIPVAQKIDFLSNRFFGQSLLAICRRDS